MSASINPAIPANVDPDVAFAAVQYAHGNFENAIERLVDTTPGDAWAAKRLGLEALTYLRLRKHEQAKLAAEEAREQSPETAMVHLILARVHGECSEWEEAITACEDAARCEPILPLAHVMAGNYAVAAGKHDEAIAAYEQALRLNPQMGQVYYWLADLYLKKGDEKRAIDAVESALRIDIRPAVRLTLADLYRDQGKHEAALREYRSVMDTYQCAEVAHRIGEVLVRSGRHVEAIESFHRALEIDVRRPNTSYAAGMANLHLRRYEAAADCFNKTLQLAPAMTEAVSGLAQAYKGLGKPGAEIAKLKQRLELDPARTEP